MSSETSRPSSPFYRPGKPGYALRCFREAAGLTRPEAAQLCNMPVPFLKQVEFYDDGNCYLWAAMESRYHLVLASEILAASVGQGRNKS